MDNTDATNAFFELFGALITTFSIYRLWKDKEVKGVSLWPSYFFITWGVWNLIFYSALQQSVSFYGAILMLSVNVIWLGLALYYKRLTRA